jgi:hypothetical protein
VQPQVPRFEASSVSMEQIANLSLNGIPLLITNANMTPGGLWDVNHMKVRVVAPLCGVGR